MAHIYPLNVADPQESIESDPHPVDVHYGANTHQRNNTAYGNAAAEISSSLDRRSPRLSI